jgi:threonine/homoserine/homoserine lactone efflux protein
MAAKMFVAFVFSSAGPQRAYLSYKSWGDRAAGAVMFGLGLKLVTSTAKP